MRCRGALIKTKQQQVCKAGEFLVAEIDAKVGGFGIVPDSLTGSIVSSHYFLFRVDDSKLDRRYLDYFTRTPTFREQVEAQGTTNYAAIRPAHVLGYEIPLPPLAEQRRLVARIEELAAIIWEARGLRRQAAIEAQAILPSIRSARFAELRTKHPQPPLGELISMASGEGLTYSVMDDAAPYPVYGGGGLNGRHTSYMFDESKIVIGRVGARCGCVFVTEPKAWITDNALYLKEISDDLDPQYLVHALTTLDLRRQANHAAQPVVSQKNINPLTIPVPPMWGQHQVVRELAAIQSEVNAVERRQAGVSNELDALLPAILDRAFKGELV